MNGWLWLVCIGGALAIKLGHEVWKDRREHGEWIWQAWRRGRKP